MFSRLYGIKKGDMITFDDLKKILVGKIWENKFDEGSNVYELLMKLPNTVEDIGLSEKKKHKIDKQDMLILCFLWCGGSPRDKA